MNFGSVRYDADCDEGVAPVVVAVNFDFVEEQVEELVAQLGDSVEVGDMCDLKIIYRPY